MGTAASKIIDRAACGKVGGIESGVREQATGEILFFTDVRQALDPMALRHLVANFADLTVGAVTGEMRLRKAEAGEQADMDLYWRYELWARDRQTRIDSIFNTTGCIYAMRRKLAVPLRPDTLSDDAALPLGAFFAGYRVIFDADAIAVDDPAVAGTEFRRRFRNLAGLWQTFVRFPQLFSSRNRMRLHFLSHKFGRLVLPWAIVFAIVGTLMLPASTIRSTLLAAEAALLPLLALDRSILPQGFPAEASHLAGKNVRGHERRVDGGSCGLLHGTDAPLAAHARQNTIRRTTDLPSGVVPKG